MTISIYAVRLGQRLHELETNRTIGGLPLPDAGNIEQDDWYARLGRMLLEDIGLEGPVGYSGLRQRVLHAVERVAADE